MSAAWHFCSVVRLHALVSRISSPPSRTVQFGLLQRLDWFWIQPHWETVSRKSRCRFSSMFLLQDMAEGMLGDGKLEVAEVAAATLSGLLKGAQPPAAAAARKRFLDAASVATNSQRKARRRGASAAGGSTGSWNQHLAPAVQQSPCVLEVASAATQLQRKARRRAASDAGEFELLKSLQAVGHHQSLLPELIQSRLLLLAHTSGARPVASLCCSCYESRSERVGSIHDSTNLRPTARMYLIKSTEQEKFSNGLPLDIVQARWRRATACTRRSLG